MSGRRLDSSLTFTRSLSCPVILPRPELASQTRRSIHYWRQRIALFLFWKQEFGASSPSPSPSLGSQRLKVCVTETPVADSRLPHYLSGGHRWRSCDRTLLLLIHHLTRDRE